MELEWSYMKVTECVIYLDISS